MVIEESLDFMVIEESLQKADTMNFRCEAYHYKWFTISLANTFVLQFSVFSIFCSHHILHTHPPPRYSQPQLIRLRQVSPQNIIQFLYEMCDLSKKCAHLFFFFFLFFTIVSIFIFHFIWVFCCCRKYFQFSI